MRRRGKQRDREREWGKGEGERDERDYVSVGVVMINFQACTRIRVATHTPIHTQNQNTTLDTFTPTTSPLFPFTNTRYTSTPITQAWTPNTTWVAV